MLVIYHELGTGLADAGQAFKLEIARNSPLPRPSRLFHLFCVKKSFHHMMTLEPQQLVFCDGQTRQKAYQPAYGQNYAILSLIITADMLRIARTWLDGWTDLIHRENEGVPCRPAPVLPILRDQDHNRNPALSCCPCVDQQIR
jgi:hypothetical protein